ncbi:MAG: TetR family transcriptional regulator [Actinobacteria bacterium]|nr:TetR family transcriptional regulator [Actinomycetota bacterium]
MPTSSPATTNSLSRERIVDEAIALLDEEGEGALSMRRLAQRLGVSTMSTYHHVKDKEALLDLVTSRVMADLELPAPDASWQDAVRTMCWSFRHLTHAHPAVFRMVLARPRPAGMLVTSQNVRSVLTDRGLDDERATIIFRCCVRYLLGSTLGEVGGFGGLGIDRKTEDARRVFEAGVEALIAGFDATA